jgi:hypothetical protein
MMSGLIPGPQQPVKVPSDYLMNVARLISLSDLKVAPNVKSHDCHVMLMQIIIVRIQNILPINVREAIINFCFSSMQLIKKY